MSDQYQQIINNFKTELDSKLSQLAKEFSDPQVFQEKSQELAGKLMAEAVDKINEITSAGLLDIEKKVLSIKDNLRKESNTQVEKKLAEVRAKIKSL